MQQHNSSNPTFEIKRLQETIRILNKEIDELKFKISSSSSGRLLYVFPVHWGLTAREGGLLFALYNSAMLTKTAFMEEFYYSRNIVVDDKIYDVYVSKLRKKIRIEQLPIEIVTNWGLGYYLTEDSKTFLSQYMIKMRSYEEMQMTFDRQPWHSYDDKSYMLHEQAISKLQSLSKTVEISQERYAIAYARLCGFIRDQSATLLGPLGD